MNDYFKHQAHPRQISPEELQILIEKQRELELKKCQIAPETPKDGADVPAQTRKHKLDFLKEIHRNLLLCRIFVDI